MNTIQLRSWALCLLAVACAVAAPLAGHAQAISGDARALDGDSLIVSGREVRLFGIDAPELDQTCEKEDSAWACGEMAKGQLASLVAGQRVDCRGQGVDHHGRILAVCAVGPNEINRITAEQGWAIAYRQFSEAYVPAELQAKAQRRGIWASTFVEPSDYRLAKLPPAERFVAAPQRPSRSATSGCLIKGNHSRKGEWIYHLPGMPYYAQTRAEAMFCSEAEAIAAGYRRSRARN